MTSIESAEPVRNTENAEADQAFTLRSITGSYAFRFKGYTMLNNIRYFLLGVGHFRISADGRISGDQRSSITPLQGQKAALDTSAYSLAGTIKLGEGGAGEAFIRFRKTSGGGLDVDGNFFVQVAGSADRLWFISSGASVPKFGISADELVTLEAVRM